MIEVTEEDKLRVAICQDIYAALEKHNDKLLSTILKSLIDTILNLSYYNAVLLTELQSMTNDLLTNYDLLLKNRPPKYEICEEIEDEEPS